MKVPTVPSWSTTTGTRRA